MRCKNCGASVPSRLPACEYCGTVNEVYIRRKQELDLLKNIFNKARRRAIIEAVPDVVIGVLNRFIILAAVMMLVVLSVSFAVHWFNIRIPGEKPVGNEKEHLMVLERMRDEKRYDEIGDYLYRYNLFSEQYAAYLQAKKLYDIMDMFWSYKDSYEKIRKEIENGASPQFYTEEDAKKKYVDIMRKAYDIVNYANEGILSENREYYQECSMEVTAYLKYILGLNDDEIKKLCEVKYSYSDEFTDYCRKLYDQYSSQ